jgi:hypothetical protein
MRQRADNGGEGSSVSLITAADPGRLGFLGELDASVCELKRLVAGTGCRIEWVVVLDGPGDGGLPEQLAGVDHVSELGVMQGVAAARNYALTICSGKWIFAIDADDVLAPAGMARVATQHLQDEIGWIATNRRWHHDASRTIRWISEARTWKKGELEEAWTSPFPFHPNNMFVRREVVLEVGGWPALGVLEDLSYCLHVSAVATGVADPTTTVFYRSWSDQTTQLPRYPIAKVQSVEVIESMINDRRRRAGLLPITAPVVTHH